MTEQELRELKFFADVLRFPLNYPVSALDETAARKIARLRPCGIGAAATKRLPALE